MNPCPFCGYLPLPINVQCDGRTIRAEHRYWLECPKCLACGPVIDGKNFGDRTNQNDAIIAWNTRKPLGVQ